MVWFHTDSHKDKDAARMTPKTLIFKPAVLFAALLLAAAPAQAKTFFVPKNASAQAEKLNGDYGAVKKDARNYAANGKKKRKTPREMRKQQHRQYKAQRNDNAPSINE